MPIKTNTVETSFQYKDLAVFKDVVFLPNPSFGIFKVKLENDKDFVEEIKYLEIIDTRGRIVHKYVPTELQPEVDISYVPAAMYILRVHDIYDNVFSSKLIKM